MAEKCTTSIRVTTEVRDSAKEVFKALGLDFSNGIEIYLRYVARHGAIPFRLDLGDVVEVLQESNNEKQHKKHHV